MRTFIVLLPFLLVACETKSGERRAAPNAVRQPDAGEVCATPENRAAEEKAAQDKRTALLSQARAEVAPVREHLTGAVAAATRDGKVGEVGRVLDESLVKLDTVLGAHGVTARASWTRDAVMGALSDGFTCRAVAADDPAPCRELAKLDAKRGDHCAGRLLLVRRLASMISMKACDDVSASRAAAVYDNKYPAKFFAALCEAGASRDPRACSAFEPAPAEFAVCQAIAAGSLAPCDAAGPSKDSCRDRVATVLVAAQGPSVDAAITAAAAPDVPRLAAAAAHPAKASCDALALAGVETALASATQLE